MRTVIDLATTSSFFAENDQSEVIFIDMVDSNYGVMYGTGEESGEKYVWNLNEIDLSTASWWEITLNV